jgi:hypothetical protein
MSFLDRLRAWWSADKLERAESETRMTQGERDVAEEDFEGRKEDVVTRNDFVAGGTADYEHDSEPPRPGRGE